MFGIHAKIEGAIIDELKPENAGPNIFSNALKEKGIILSEAQLKSLSRKMKKASGSITINLDEEQIEKSQFTSKHELLDFLNSIVSNFDVHVEKYTALICSRSTDSFPEIIDNISGKILSNIESNIIELSADRNKTYNSFSRRLGRQWKIPLIRLNCLIAVSDEFAEGYIFENRSTSDFGIKNQIFSRMLGKANQIAKEIYTLLKNGYSDGAMARWRSLHELSVISMFLCENDQETAEMYVDHETIEVYQTILSHNIHCDRFNEYPIDQKIIDEYKLKTEELLRKYGNEFKSEYGWAAKATNNRRPTFRNIEENVRYDLNRPFYKTASANIHISAYGVRNSLGLYTPNSTIIAGPSNIGLSTPGRLTCNSLVLTILSVAQQHSTLDFLIASKVISDLANEAIDSFLSTEDELVEKFGNK